MGLYMCRGGHIRRTQFGADNCGTCRNAGRPKPKKEFKLDAVGRLMVRAARVCENQHLHPYEKTGGKNMHPVRAIYLANHCRPDATFNAAVRRLFDCCGADFMDHSREENIDDLVAAAHWEGEK